MTLWVSFSVVLSLYAVLYNSIEQRKHNFSPYLGLFSSAEGFFFCVIRDLEKLRVTVTKLATREGTLSACRSSKGDNPLGHYALTSSH